MSFPKIKRLAERVKLTGKRYAEKRWIKLIVDTANKLGRENAGDMAAGIAYYAILSLFPLSLGAIALLGLFLPSATVQEELISAFEHYLPASVDILKENISRIIELRGALGIISLIGFFWTGSAIFSAIDRAVNRACGVRQSRAFHIRKLRDLALGLGTSILILLSLGITTAVVLLPAVELPLGLGLAVIISNVLSFIFMLSSFLLIYRFMPNPRLGWCCVWPGAVFAAVLFEASRAVFAFYLTQFARYEMIYGSIASFVVFLVWVYVSAFILILGAGFSSEYEKMKTNRPPAERTETR
ncbi:MAG: hypothetical protein A2Z29_09645 [Chloroflexi bacterium RBG_16_56_11]|nr:MAG: hypothetical protein A2Z29_09645 [Chloroflexi bacterium RBG_16_56_11]